jgi:uncharacterized protein
MASGAPTATPTSTATSTPPLALLAPVRRFPVGAFLLLSFAWSWRAFVPALLRGEPSPGLDPFGPLVAAVAVTAACGGRAAVSPLLRKLVAWRVAPRWWAFALLVPVLLSSVAALAAIASGAPAPPPGLLARWPSLLLAFPVVLVVAGPLGEELGWRGFLLPRARAGRSETAAALLVGVAWAAWHLPLLVGLPAGAAIASAAGIAAASVLFGVLDRGSGGSVLLAMVFHAAQNTFGGEYLGPMFTGPAAVRLAWWRSAVWLLAAAATLAVRRARSPAPRSGRTPP